MIYQVAKGFEQLGSDKTVVRLRGIYALEGVMNTSDQYYRPVLEALSAFVREGAKPPTALGPPTVNNELPTDIQATLTVIGRRSAGLGIADLSNANIAGTRLTGANLIEADLTDANLTDARRDRVDLTRASLRGQNQLDSAFGSAAKLPMGLTLKPCRNRNL